MISLMLVAILTHGANALAQNWDGTFFDPATNEEVSLDQVISNQAQGSVVILGEQHDLKIHHDHQKLFLTRLAAMHSDLPLSVGMEFFDFPHQDEIDEYLAGSLKENEFLKAMQWGAISFDLYRDQVNFPKYHDGKTYGLNIPMKIASRIREVGVSHLTTDERALLPSDFRTGNSLYRERFMNLMSHHPVPALEMDRFFEAQSAWDDAMAFHIKNAMRENLDQILVVIVGNFHVEYGGGLPDRLASRGVQNVTAIPQLDATGMSEEELQEMISPDLKFGPMGDFIWISGEPVGKK